MRSANMAIDPGEREMLDKGKSVALIWGIDKPRIMSLGKGKGEKVFMALRDKPMVISSPSPHNPNGTEYFYWTPDLPMLAWEMAYRAYRFFDANPNLRDIIQRTPENRPHGNGWRSEEFCDYVDNVTYTHKNPFTFQCKKPTWGVNNADMRPGDMIIETLPEVWELRKKWKYLWNSYDAKLDRSMPTILPNGEFSSVPTRWYWVGEYTN